MYIISKWLSYESTCIVECSGVEGFRKDKKLRVVEFETEGGVVIFCKGREEEYAPGRKHSFLGGRFLRKGAVNSSIHFLIVCPVE